MRRFYCNCCGEEWTASGNITDGTEVECPNCGALYDRDDESIIESFNAEEPQQKSFRCNACGAEFSEPDGAYEKLRCPNCDAIAEDGTIECIAEDCPLGGDISDDCADCAYSGDYHFENGNCVERNSCKKNQDGKSVEAVCVALLTNEECNILDQIASKSKMDCWFWIEETDDGHVIHDLEADKKMPLWLGISQLLEGITENADFYGLSEKQVFVFENLLKRLGITDGSSVFNCSKEE